ncbi:putative secreted protein [Maribacter sp. HTCC2170]|nr:lamin tail domain-containing protein [Maribacter sp. HTCC2170]EAR01118.1 putative secreted protein [Maribacter sp. HTCC2170]
MNTPFICTGNPLVKIIAGLFLLFNTTIVAQISFNQSQLDFNGLGSVDSGVTSLMYGPDGRLYVAEYPGTIKILTVEKTSLGDYTVIAVEALTGVTDIVNHDDDGTINNSQVYRETIGLTVSGTSVNPVIYVSSSDFRIGAGSSGGNGDIELDTNSGIITRFSWNGTSWDVVDLVRGLPRSEENHATNGLEKVNINGTNYLIVASGGFTNGGGPSTNFVYSCEYALSGAILSIDLDAINALPVLMDNGRAFLYDLPTLDDPERANENGIIDPDDIGYNGIDVNDPFGGNDGLNQAMVVPNGPVQIYSPGYRNAYDLVVTENGALYVTENGANQGWGGFPVNEGTANVTNDYDPNELGSQSPSGGEYINNLDHLEMVTFDIQNYVPGSFYAGHPNPTRANPSGAGLFVAPNQIGTTNAVFRTLIYDPDGSRGAGYTTDPNIALPANWPPVSVANSVEGDWRGPGIVNPDGLDDIPITIWSTNTNGIDEYTASNFSGAMKGNLLAGHNAGLIHRVELANDGTLQQLTSSFLSGIGGNALGITCNGDNEIFPGTIWAGTLNGKIVVFEPSDGSICLSPGDFGYDPIADYDNDGYTNQDEEDNGTDPCNGGSQPNDFDKSIGGTLLSDLNDNDDDGDGILDSNDPFQLGDPDSTGSDAFVIPVSNDLFNDQEGLNGIFGLGLTGLMNNGNTNENWLSWIDRRDDPNDPNPNDVLGGATGLMTSHMTSGTALGSTNTQDKGYQFGVQTDVGTGIFTVSGNLINLTGPLRIYGNSAALGGELGHFIGDGTQSNYIKIVLNTSGITALQEINDIPQTPINIPISVSNRPANDIVFYFTIDPSNGQVDLEYAIDGGTRAGIGTVTAQGSILDAIQQANQDLAAGFIGTSGTTDVELEGTWDFLSVIPEDSTDSLLGINAGGVLIDQNGTTFVADEHFVGGTPYTNPSALVPDMYKTERSSPSKTFQYSIPITDGDYTVVLHFAEIYWGATGGGPGGSGQRVFDVTVEGNLVLDNYDIFSEVGAEVAQQKSFDVTVNDGSLNIDFSALAAVGGIDQPKVSAIEILSGGVTFPPLILEPIVDQANVINDNISFGVTATGGDSNANFTYQISGQPDGVQIEPTNGLISGIISSAAASGGANNDGQHVVSVAVSKPGSATVNQVFNWNVGSENWVDKNENENYTARHENSFVQAGDKFYLMGGRENSRSIDVYDYSSDTWNTLVDSAPFEFNHFQATEYQGLIWVIGAFQTNAFPTEAPAEYVWAFDPANEEWIEGAQIPQSRRRGSAGLVVRNDKFYIVGGNTNGHDAGFVSFFDEYDPATGIWTSLTDAPRARDHFAAAIINDKLYAAGGRLTSTANGYFEPTIPEVDVYDFATSTWSTLPAVQNIPTPRGGASAVNFNDKLLVIGGEIGGQTQALAITEEYDPNTDTWTSAASLNSPRHGTQVIVSGNGVFMVAGSPLQGAGNQRNMEVLGVDNPEGTASIASVLSAPTSVTVPDAGITINLDVNGGNQGIIINSIELTGTDAQDFNTSVSSPESQLIKSGMQLTIPIGLVNPGPGKTANLVINYGAGSEMSIALQSDGAVEDLAFSQERGLYEVPFNLSLFTGILGATIRYTLDGSTPSTTSGTIYNGNPLTVNTTTTVRAIAYSGSTESEVGTHSYIFLSDVVQQPANITGWPNNVYNLGTGGAQATHDYEMDPAVVNAPEYSNDIISGLSSIPTMSIVMDKDDFWTVYDGEVGIDGSIEIIYPNGAFPNEQFIAELESHSHLRLKRSMKLDINNSISSNLLRTGPLSGDVATDNFTDTKFVLRGGNNRAWSRNWNADRTAFTRDEWYRASQIAASGIGKPGAFVHLYVNGLYWGMYNPVQRQDAGFMAAYFGGENDDYMTLNHNGVKSGDATRFDYLTNTLVNQDMSIQANYEEVKQYLDIEKFMDYLMVTWSMGMTDWPLNNFYGGNRNNPAEPFNYYAWDGEWSWDTTNGSNNGAWVHPFFRSSQTGSEPISNLWHSLRANPEFMQLFVDRVNLQFFNNGPISDNASRARWATVNQYIETAVIAESARWGDGLNDGQTRTKNDDWQPEVDRLDALMNGNAERFLDALRVEGYYPALDAAVFNNPGGSVIASFELEMTNPNPSGTIYYTTDGTDPQLPNGSVSGSAIAYSSPIDVPDSGILEIIARVNDGSDWSASTEASYAEMELYINEFLASNVTGITDESGANEDWIEFYNAGVLPVDLGGMYITDDLVDLTQWQIPDTSTAETTIPAGGFLYVWADKDPEEGPLHVDIKLGSGGEAIGLSIDSSTGIQTIDSYTFGPQADDISEGRFSDGENNFVTFDNPTPGAPNEIGFLSGIYINEFIAGNETGIVDEAGEFEDWIEIYNSNDTPVDIGGLYITDDLTNPLLFKIPTDNPTATTIPAGGFIILWADNEPLEGTLHVGLKLGKSGEDIGLTQIIGVEQQFIDSLTYGAQSDDVSYGREPDGGSTFSFYFQPTPGSSNIIPFVAGLSINEVLAINSTSITDPNGENDPWVEVYNLNENAVDIGGLYVSNDASNPSLWQIPDTNPSLTTIPAGGFITLWADNQTSQGELHLPFTLSSGGGTIVISDIIGTDMSTVDSMTYAAQTNDISFGRYPDASEQFKSFSAPTPNNNNILPLVTNVFINEYMASNAITISDEAGEFDDWIELYNAGTTAVDVGGLFIVDDLTEADPYQIPTTSPSETTIPPGGFLLLWADKQESQGVLHVGVKLSGGGEQIGLLQINGNDNTFIDSLIYTAQTEDISEGRSFDGGPTFVNFTSPTPNASNGGIPSGVVTSLTLINATSDQDITTINDGDVLSMQDLPTNLLSIRANAIDVGSIQFELSGALTTSNVENAAPYSLYGDVAGDYIEQVFVVGNYTLTATPFTGPNLTGTQGPDFTINFEITEDSSPTAICQNITVSLDENGNVTITGDDVDNGSSAPDGIASLTVFPNSFDCNDIGNNTVILTVTDTNNNTSTCSATVTVEDDTATVITCPDNISVPSSNGSPVIVTITPPIVVDNCSTFNTITGIRGDALALTDPFPVGITMIEWTATDEEGNSSTCMQNVEVTFSGIPGNDITSFSLPTELAPASIDAIEKTVNVTVAFGSDITSLAPNIGVSADAVIDPAPGALIDFTNPVIYKVTSSDEVEQQWIVTVTVAPEASDEIWLEAECAIAGVDWSFIDNVSSSNGQHLLAPSGNNLSGPPSNTDQMVTFDFQADAGTYSVHALVQASTGADDSFWVRSNGGTWIRWNKITNSPTFVWDQVHDSDNSSQPVIFNLAQGSNTIDIALREDGASLDKIYITSTTNLPTGLGDMASNCVIVPEPPTADAGSDQNIMLPANSAVFSGIGNDPDGGAIVSYAWTQESGGPSTATLAGENTTQFTASDLIEGTYVFRLTVTDDEGDTGFDLVSVTVEAIVLLPPTADAGSDQNIMLPANSAVFSGIGNDPDGGAIVSYAWTQESGGPSTATLAGENTTQFTASDLIEGTYVFRLTVTDDEGDTGFDLVSVTVSPETSDEIWLEAECAIAGVDWSFIDNVSSSNGQHLLAPSGNNLSGPPSNTDQMVTFDFQADAGTYSVHALVQASTGADDSFWVRSNGGTWIRWNKITNSPTFVWDQVHDSDNSSQPVIFNLAQGSNTIDIALREDGASLDKIYITSTTNLPTGLGDMASNCVIVPEPPTADAGSDQNIMLPANSAVFSGIGNDPDGGAIVSYAWTQESGGPSTATLAGENTTQFTASDLIEGTYVFRLTVTDDEGDTGFDLVSVTVEAIVLLPPTADAGSDQNIMLPANSAVFSGIGNDPDGGAIVSYAWTQESGGPSTATLAGEIQLSLRPVI